MTYNEMSLSTFFKRLELQTATYSASKRKRLACMTFSFSLKMTWLSYSYL